jgi:hypothetical protein
MRRSLHEGSIFVMNRKNEVLISNLLVDEEEENVIDVI